MQTNTSSIPAKGSKPYPIFQDWVQAHEADIPEAAGMDRHIFVSWAFHASAVNNETSCCGGATERLKRVAQTLGVSVRELDQSILHLCGWSGRKEYISFHYLKELVPRVRAEVLSSGCAPNISAAWYLALGIFGIPGFALVSNGAGYHGVEQANRVLYSTGEQLKYVSAKLYQVWDPASPELSIAHLAYLWGYDSPPDFATRVVVFAKALRQTSK